MENENLGGQGVFDKKLREKLVMAEIELDNKPKISQEPANLVVRKEVLAWLEKKLKRKKESSMLVEKTITALDMVEERCYNAHLIETGLYEITDLDQIEKLTEKIVLNPALIDITTKKLAYTLYNALETYHDFLEKGPEDFEEEQTAADYEYDGPINEAGFIAFLDKQGVEYIDKRARGGGFWIKGGFENAELVKYCKSKFGIKFMYNDGSARVLKGIPGWWTRKLC